jgi:peptidoglycan/xylan/chitin deacetylase (PgdA/CDA1 family)
LLACAVAAGALLSTEHRTRSVAGPPARASPRRATSKRAPRLAPHATEAARERAALARLLRIGRPVYCGGARGRFLALTFDDGPGPYTQLALEILRHNRARATFFLVGRNLARAGDLPAQELLLGAVGDHTWTHADLLRMSLRQVTWQLEATRRAIRQATGTPVTLFRPPYGAHDALVDRVARSLGLLEVLWSIDTRDSEGARWHQIGALVGRNARPGSIVLMHENRGQTIRALRFVILPFLHRHRLVAVTLPRLLALDPPSRAQLGDGPGGCYPRRVPVTIRGTGD